MSLIGVLVAMTLILFLLQQVIPADPARAAVGPNAPRAIVEAKRKEMGLDRSLPERYWLYVERLAQGDFGESIHTRNPVAKDLAHYVPASMELVGTALILGVGLGAMLGLPQRQSRLGGGLRIGLIGAASVPIFLTGLLLLLLFWFKLGWLPGGGRLSPDDFRPGPTGLLVLDGLLTAQPRMSLDAIAHLFLPALTLALPIAVAIGRTLASSLVDVYRKSYIRTARAKGLTEEAVLWRHALRNAAGPPLSMISLQVALVFGNLLVVERVFSWPGLGLYTVQAFGTADLPAILGVALVFGAAYLIVATIIDVIRAALDPRLSLE